MFIHFGFLEKDDRNIQLSRLISRERMYIGYNISR